MSGSPFHGIFSAFQNEHESDGGGRASSSGTGGAAGTAAGRKTAVQLKVEAGAEDGAVGGNRTHHGQIAVDVYEADGYIIVRAPIAGVKLSDLDIEVDGNTLTLRGSRPHPEAIPEDQYYLQECYWGDFERIVTLPHAIDARKVRATFSKDGILKVLVPKEEKIKIVRINEA